MTNQTSTPIDNGLYFLHPDGSAWIAAKFRDGRMWRAEESDAATHAAAGDDWAGVVPSDEDEEVEHDTAEAVVLAVMGPDADPLYVIVTRPRDLSAPRAAALALAESLVGEWTGWEWPHDPGGLVVTGPGAVDDWDAWQAQRLIELDARDADDTDAEGLRDAEDIAQAERDYGEEAQSEAERAEGCLRDCIAAMEADDWATALDEARQASRCEREYGDDPTYGPLVSALKACQMTARKR